MKKDWLITHCALCGDPFPLTSPLYANMSQTVYQSQLPCPCETRKPVVPEVPPKPIEEWTQDDVARLLEDYNTRPVFGAKVDLDP